MVRVCSRCGEENSEQAPFCQACASPLSGSNDFAGGMRKTVTTVFCDVVGSTALGERVDPETLRGAMNRYFQEIGTILERHGGTVEKFIGDAVMAVFGIPTSHEDDALRAVRAAAEIRDSLASLNEGLKTRWGVSLDLRTGINTGVVIAGDPSRGQSFATGDAVNVAARLEQQADPGEILIGNDTYRVVRDAIVADPVEPFELKGKAEPMPAWRLRKVVGLVGVARRLDSPLVGRAEELKQLNGVFEQAVRRRSCELAMVLGAAGIGKSRLTTEFVGSLGDRATILRGRCLSYGEGITFWPVAEIVREAAGVKEDDSLDDARTKIAALIPESYEHSAMISERVSTLFGLGESAAGLRESFWALRRLFEAMAQIRPLVVVLDDLHWAEATFLDLVDYVVAFSNDAPMLFLCLARPEFVDASASWPTAHASATTFTLVPLKEAESETLIDNLLGDVNLAGKTRDPILLAAQGNPLFVEEMLRMLIDEHLLEKDDGRWVASGDVSEALIPPTIDALLAARLDRLSPGEREALQCGSIVGEVFWWGYVAEMSSSADRVGTFLQALVRKDLIRPESESLAGEDAFRFNHLLIRDAVYHSIPKLRRADLHERFAIWLEHRAGERISEYEEIVAYHFEQAYKDLVQLGPENDQARWLAVEAAKRLRSAGLRALTKGDIPATENFFARAATLMPQTNPARPALLLDMAGMWNWTGNYQRSSDLLDEVLASAASSGDQRLRAHAALERALLRMSLEPQGSVEHAAKEAECALRLFEEDRDDLGLCKAWWVRAEVESLGGHFERMREACEKALFYARRCGDERRETYLRDYILMALDHGPTPVDDVISQCEEEISRREEKGHLLRAGDIMIPLARQHAQKGRFANARDLIIRAKSIVQDLGIEFIPGLSWTSGAIELLADNDARAEEELRSSYEVFKEAGEKGYSSTVVTLLGEAMFKLGKYDDAEECCRISKELADSGDLLSQVRWRWLEAKIRARQGRAEEAVALVQESVSLTMGSDALNMRGDALLACAEVQQLAENTVAALASAEEALRMYEQKGNAVSAGKASKLLTELVVEPAG